MESDCKKVRTRLNIGIDIAECLSEIGMSHEKLAEKLGVSEKTVDRMVAGKGPTTKYAKALSKHLKKLESWFVEDILWEECEKEEYASTHFEVKNLLEKDKEFAKRVVAFMEQLYNIPDEKIRDTLMDKIEKNFDDDRRLIKIIMEKEC